jgi:hypothetical protein
MLYRVLQYFTLILQENISEDIPYRRRKKMGYIFGASGDMGI